MGGGYVAKLSPSGAARIVALGQLGRSEMSESLIE